jgi:hypothetical protein
MSANSESALDNLAAFVHAVAQDRTLQERFRKLAKMLPAERFNDIQVMAHAMAAEGHDGRLVDSLRLLADARVFAAALAALRDSGCDIQ